jgi:HlyD family secretion protein
MKKWIGRSILIVIVLAVIVGVVYSMRPKPTAVDVVTVASGPLKVTVDGEGRTRVKDRYVIMSTVHGDLARIELEVGDEVTEQTIVARIEPTAPPLLDARQREELKAQERASGAAARQAKATMARAEASAAHARRELESAKRLFTAGTLSARELEDAELDADVAQKDLDSARFGARVAQYEHDMAKVATGRVEGTAKGAAPLASLDIHSPIAGKVLHIVRMSEGVVQPGEALVEVADPTALEVVLDVLTAEAVEITVGDAVEITQWGGEQPLQGHVVLIEPAAFTKVSALGVEEQRVNVIVELDDPPESWSRLGDGFRVEAAVTIWQAEGVLAVPISALFRVDGSWAVFVVRDGVAEVRTLTTGRRNDFDIQVESGVDAGEQIIVHPSDAIVDGSLVAAR